MVVLVQNSTNFSKFSTYQDPSKYPTKGLCAIFSGLTLIQTLKGGTKILREA